MGNPLTKAMGNVLTTLMGNVLTELVGKVLDIYNLKHYKVYSYAGFSGASLDRPTLKEMLNDIIEGNSSF